MEPEDVARPTVAEPNPTSESHASPPVQVPDPQWGQGAAQEELPQWTGELRLQWEQPLSPPAQPGALKAASDLEWGLAAAPAAPAAQAATAEQVPELPRGQAARPPPSPVVVQEAPEPAAAAVAAAASAASAAAAGSDVSEDLAAFASSLGTHLGGKNYNNLFVANLPSRWLRFDLMALFQEFEPTDCVVIMDPRAGKSKRIGFVDVGSEAKGRAAIAALNGIVLPEGPKKMVQLLVTASNFDGSEVKATMPLLFVRNIPRVATEEGIREMFEEFGNVVKLQLERSNDGVTWLGQIEYATIPQAVVAVGQLHGVRKFGVGRRGPAIHLEFVRSEEQLAAKRARVAKQAEEAAAAATASASTAAPPVDPVRTAPLPPQSSGSVGPVQAAGTPQGRKVMARFPNPDVTPVQITAPQTGKQTKAPAPLPIAGQGFPLDPKSAAWKPGSAPASTAAPTPAKAPAPVAAAKAPAPASAPAPVAHQKPAVAVPPPHSQQHPHPHTHQQQAQQSQQVLHQQLLMHQQHQQHQQHLHQQMQPHPYLLQHPLQHHLPLSASQPQPMPLQMPQPQAPQPPQQLHAAPLALPQQPPFIFGAHHAPPPNGVVPQPLAIPGQDETQLQLQQQLQHQQQMQAHQLHQAQLQQQHEALPQMYVPSLLLPPQPAALPPPPPPPGAMYGAPVPPHAPPPAVAPPLGTEPILISFGGVMGWFVPLGHLPPAAPPAVAFGALPPVA